MFAVVLLIVYWKHKSRFYEFTQKIKIRKGSFGEGFYYSEIAIPAYVCRVDGIFRN